MLSSSYTKVKSLQSELDALTSEDTTETDELMIKVNQVIEPTYSRKRSDSLFSAIFYLVSVASSFLSMILPYSIYQIIIFLVFLFQLIIGIRTMINLLKMNYTRNELAIIVHKAFLVAAIVFLVISLLVTALHSYIIFSTNYYIEHIIFFMTSSIAYVLHIVFGCKYFLKESRQKLIIWLILSILSLILIIAFFSC